MEIRIRKVPDGGGFREGMECWMSGGRAYLLIRVGTACERIAAEAVGGVVKVLKMWPGDDRCGPLLCAEVVPPHYYIVEVFPGNEAGNLAFRVLKAIDCGGKEVDVVGLIGECVPRDSVTHPSVGFGPPELHEG